MTYALAVRDGAFKKCCMRSGTYDGSRRNYFFPRITPDRHEAKSFVLIGTVMYLRFVVSEIDEDSERALGVFHAVWGLRDAGKLQAFEKEQHDTIRWWFSASLERPTRFTAAKAPFYRKKNRGLSWFKHTAAEHIAQIHGLIWILEDHGVYVRRLKAKRVGYVVYEDEYQVVAEPFSDMTC